MSQPVDLYYKKMLLVSIFETALTDSHDFSSVIFNDKVHLALMRYKLLSPVAARDSVQPILLTKNEYH